MIDYLLYIIALSLSIDCFIVSVAISSSLKINKLKYFIPIHFSIFHMFMLISGFFLGELFLEIIQRFDHLIAFSLLFLVGLKMSVSSFNNKKYSGLRYADLLFLSIATSIDALAIGITFNIVNGSIFYKSLIVGFFVLIICAMGLILGEKLKKFKFNYLGLFGGLIMIFLGFKILIEHLI